jgi:hypothetical protein
MGRVHTVPHTFLFTVSLQAHHKYLRQIYAAFSIVMQQVSNEGELMDIAYLLFMVLFFAVTGALVYGCEKLRGQS